MRLSRLAEGLVVVALTLAASSTYAANLVVIVPEVRPGPGSIRVALYQRADSFRHEGQAFHVLSVPATQKSTSVTFTGVPAGRYAIVAYQDTNDNKRLDLRFGMFPREPWGLSNDPKVMGPPSFEAAAFDVTEPLSRIEVRLHY